MKKLILLLNVLSAGFSSLRADEAKADAEGFTPIFDGKTLEGWKANKEDKDAKVFTVQDGKLVVKGGRAHLFYTGKDGNATFHDFELKAKVLTKTNANSGLYFHTEFQEEGWPAKGYEAQVNNSFTKDPRKTGSLYAVKDQHGEVAKDDEWFDYHIKVVGKKITIAINGKVTAEYEEKEGDTRGKSHEGKWLKGGTFAIQAHDPGCEVHYKDIKIKVPSK
jgi:hypothetical protein